MWTTTNETPNNKELEDIAWHRERALAALEGRYDTREDTRTFEEWVRDYLLEMASTWARCWNLPDVMLTTNGSHVLVKKERRHDSHLLSPVGEDCSARLVPSSPGSCQPVCHNPASVWCGGPRRQLQSDLQNYQPAVQYDGKADASPSRPRLHLVSSRCHFRPRLVLEPRPMWQNPYCSLDYPRDIEPVRLPGESSVPQIARQIPNELEETNIWPPQRLVWDRYPASSHFADGYCRPGHPTPYRPGHHGTLPRRIVNPPLRQNLPHAPARKLPSEPLPKPTAASVADTPKYTRRDENRRPAIQAPRPVRPHALVRGHAPTVVADVPQL